MTEVGSVKDNFLLSGRREESQREVKEPGIWFREAGVPVAGSSVGCFLEGRGTADEGIVCSGDQLKPTGGGLGNQRCGLGDVWLRRVACIPIRQYSSSLEVWWVRFLKDRGYL